METLKTISFNDKPASLEDLEDAHLFLGTCSQLQSGNCPD